MGPFFGGQEMGWMDTYLNQVGWFQLVAHARHEGENPLRCTTQDKKGLVLTIVFFYPIFGSP